MHPLFVAHFRAFQEIYVALMRPTHAKDKAHYDILSVRIMPEGFTFPTNDENRFIVADQVNITWEIAAPVISLYESCGSNSRTLEGKLLVLDPVYSAQS